MQKQLWLVLVLVCLLTIGCGHDEESKPAKPVKDKVVLTAAKAAEAAIEVGTAQLRNLQPIRTVPGHIEYNGTRHVSVKSPAGGLVHKIAVIVGDHVEAGQLLAVVNSPELGERRSDVLLQEAELELARRDRDWWRSVQSSLEDLLSRLKRPQDVAALEKEFDDRVLGDYRRDIFSTYSKFRTAEAISANFKGLTGGVLSERQILEQATARDSAAATFRAACELATFDARQKVGKAEAAYDDNSRRLAVARQRLTFLTGQDTDQIGDLSKEEDLSTWPVVAPFAATVEELYVAASERVTQGEDIVLLADTTRLWVKADIRDKDWSALTLVAGQTIQVQSPALPNTTLNAKIAFIGRTVNQETRATPLVADIQNDNSLLKPGMFVRVLLPDGPASECLAVPDSAVVRHEGRVFVFVVTGASEYVPRDVTLGLSVDPWVEIKSGLKPGDKIAVGGTFMLKSELLLEPEPDEE
ncbi:MAG: efflux RND transporter periplasmic adaptor subunit [Planctomycetes bacterium]|nr:efflux RND transporter periplasmic adaptor subunit [Planctomycetota bacterium]